MIDETKLKEAVKLFTDNPYWREEYETAPTEASKRWVALGFYRSANIGKLPKDKIDEIRQEERKMEELFVIDDWKHARKYCGHNPLKTKYSQKIKELEEAENKARKE